MTTQQRRILAGLLIVIGAFLLWFAPESLGGVVLLVCGVAIELAGITLEHRKSKE